MKIPSIGIVYDRKNKATETKVGSVEIRVTFNRRNKYYSTGVHVAKPYWNSNLVHFVYLIFAVFSIFCPVCDTNLIPCETIKYGMN